MIIVYTECPDYEVLINGRIDEMYDEQKIHYGILMKVCDFFNSALIKFYDSTINQYEKIPISKLCRSLNDGIFKALSCNNYIIADEVMNVLNVCDGAIRNIVSNPNSMLIKEDKKVYISDLRGFSSKTTEWLAKRTGRTVQEKIMPENKILTKKTRFTEKTLENEVTLSLYYFLYDIISERVKKSSCAECDKGLSCRRNYETAISFLNLLSKIKRGDLSEVVPKRHISPNNKLLCDKNYSAVWKSQARLNDYEESIENKWNNLFEEFKQMIFWFVVGIVFKVDSVFVDDKTGVFIDGDNKFGFYENEQGESKITSVRFIMNKTSNSYEELKIFLEDDTVMFSKKQIIFNEMTNFANTSREDVGRITNIKEIYDSLFLNN